MFHREVWPVRLATRNLAISARYVGPGRAVPEFSLTSVPRVPRPPQCAVVPRQAEGEGSATSIDLENARRRPSQHPVGQVGFGLSILNLFKRFLFKRFLASRQQ